MVHEGESPRLSLLLLTYRELLVSYISMEEQAAYTNQTIEYLKLIHPHFRRLCRILVDVDEWGQVEVMRLLLRYARVMLPKPIRANDSATDEYDFDKDLKLLLTSVEPTFMSRNPAVVLAAAKVYYYLAPSSGSPGYWKKFISPLLRLLAASQEVERVVTRYLVVLTSRQKAISVRIHFCSNPTQSDIASDFACSTLYLIPPPIS